jgi:UDP-glucose:(heptosyl)LPS alpha-1,3-glucosyltransferase
VRRRQFKGSRVVIANSEMVRRDTADSYGVPPEKIKTVYCGVDLSRFHPDRRSDARKALLAAAGWGEDAFVLLSVLSGDPAKRNFSLMARAAEEFSRRRPTGFCVVGNSSWAKDDTARRLRDQGVLHPVPVTPDVSAYFAAADAFILPAHYEEFGLTALESLASGCPVLISRRSGAAELISQGANGFVFDDLSDPGELLSFISRAAEGSLDRGACRLSAEPYTWDRHAREVASIYNELL